MSEMSISVYFVYLFTCSFNIRMSTNSERRGCRCGMMAIVGEEFYCFAVIGCLVVLLLSDWLSGSFDNEGVAIFALIFTFYLW